MKNPSKNIQSEFPLSQSYEIINKIKAKLEAPNPNLSECQIHHEILKRVQNDIIATPNQVLNLIQDLKISHLI